MSDFNNKSFADDKNVVSEAVLVEKRKMYEFGLKEGDNCEGVAVVTLGDDFLNQKLMVHSVTFRTRGDGIVGMTTSYVNGFGQVVSGYTMGSCSTNGEKGNKQQVVKY